MNYTDAAIQIKFDRVFDADIYKFLVKKGITSSDTDQIPKKDLYLNYLNTKRNKNSLTNFTQSKMLEIQEMSQNLINNYEKYIEKPK